MVTPRKKKADADLPPTENALAPIPPNPPLATPTPTSPSDTNGEGAAEEKRRPTFKVGPIATDKSASVEAAVWANQVKTADGREFTVHNVTVGASWRDSDGNWKASKSFRGSQLYALIYCLQRASDFILSQRDPANDCPF